MTDVTQNDQTRPRPSEATLLDALDAEITRAMDALDRGEDRTTALEALGVAHDLISSIELKLIDVRGLCAEGARYVKEAAGIFCIRDGDAEDHSPRENAEARDDFNTAVANAVRDLRCIVGELDAVASLRKPSDLVRLDAAAEE